MSYHNQISNKKINKSLLCRNAISLCRKAILQSKRYGKASLRARLEGSYTLEAAVCIPALAVFIISILFFFRVLMVQQDLNEAMEYTARTLSAAVFAEHYGVPENLVEAGSTAAAGIMVNSKYKSYAADGGKFINLLSSDLTGDYIDLKANYTVKLPVPLLGKRVITMHQRVKARKWNGYELAGEPTEDDNDIWVYITPYGRVYHMDRSCHYLDLSVHSVSRDRVDGKRNKSGNTYAPCELCGAGLNAGGMVYITDYGGSYHTKVNCSGLKRSVDMIRLSEAEGHGYGKCSKCGG